MLVRNWRVRDLIVSWILYWVLLIVVVAWRPILEYVRLQLTHGHGSVSVGYSGSLTQLALWIAGPPLLLWALWLLTRPRRPGERSA